MTTKRDIGPIRLVPTFIKRAAIRSICTKGSFDFSVDADSDFIYYMGLAMSRQVKNWYDKHLY